MTIWHSSELRKSRDLRNPHPMTARPQALNASFIEAVQRDMSGTCTVVWMGEAMKAIAMVGRARVYEAIALAVFAGMIVLFVHAIVPLIAD